MIASKIDKFFQISERNSTIKIEIIAGLTTFLSMMYIIVVNPGIFSGLEDCTIGAIYISTAITAFIGTLLMGLVANLPIAQAATMGVNSFFVSSLCVGMGLTYSNALVVILFSGLIFVTLSVLGVAKIMANAIPDFLKSAISVGIGLFIAFSGLKTSGIIMADTYNLVSVTNLNLFSENFWEDAMPIFITLLSLSIIAILHQKKFKGAIIVGMIASTVVFYLLGLIIPEFYNSYSINISTSSFSEFYNLSFLAVFKNGFDFSQYLSKEGASVISIIGIIVINTISLCVLSIFDTVASFHSIAECSNEELLEKDSNGNQQVIGFKRAMVCDGLATVIGAVCGTSTVSSYLESASGVSEGGRTGLCSVVTSLLFIVALLFSPLAGVVPPCVYSSIPIFIGVLMIGSIKNIKWSDISIALPAFLTIMMIPFTCSIAHGIGFGVISYVIINAFTGNLKKIKISTWVIAVLFFIIFILSN